MLRRMVALGMLLALLLPTCDSLQLAKLRAPGTRLSVSALTAELPDERARVPDERLLLGAAFLQSSCFGVIAQALPTALMQQQGLASAAMTLGQLASASAAAELCLSGTFGKISDAIGRKPLLLASPAVAVIARAAVVVAGPHVPVLIGARFFTSLAVPMYWLSFQAAIADVWGTNTTKLAVLGSRVQAAMGLGYAVSSALGGVLAARDVRFAYAASCLLGAGVVASVGLGLRETLAPAKRRPLTKLALASTVQNPLLFISLFRRGALMSRLSLLLLVHAAVNGMGDLWQVLARELRGWGAAQCGQFAAVAGLASMGGTLLTSPGMAWLGKRGFTVAASASSAGASLVLGHATTTPAAFAGVAPMALGAGKTQPITARVTTLAEEMGVPQGQLAAERSTLNAFVRVLAPSIYAALYTFGASRGVVALPFYFSAALMALAATLALSVPKHQWQ